MAVYRVTDTARVAPLFAKWPETMIWSCLQGCMGSAWADDQTAPTAALVALGDFGFLAGQPQPQLAAHRPEDAPDLCILVPQNEAWARCIEQVYGDRAQRVQRYAVKKEPGVFDQDRLRALAAELPEGYVLQPINAALFAQAKAQQWSYSLCGQFAGWEDYRRRGLGVAATRYGQLVAGASSYSVYRQGIEIEIDTRADHRRRGLATACGAALILDCLERGLYPSWDAQNLHSLALAQKLGYRPDVPYPAYEVGERPPHTGHL